MEVTRIFMFRGDQERLSSASTIFPSVQALSSVR
jgi:hypothetical protein